MKFLDIFAKFINEIANSVLIAICACHKPIKVICNSFQHTHSFNSSFVVKTSACYRILSTLIFHSCCSPSTLRMTTLSGSACSPPSGKITWQTQLAIRNGYRFILRSTWQTHWRTGSRGTMTWRKCASWLSCVVLMSMCSRLHTCRPRSRIIRVECFPCWILYELFMHATSWNIVYDFFQLILWIHIFLMTFFMIVIWFKQFAPTVKLSILLLAKIY